MVTITIWTVAQNVELTGLLTGHRPHYRANPLLCRYLYWNEYFKFLKEGAPPSLM